METEETEKAANTDCLQTANRNEAEAQEIIGAAVSSINATPCDPVANTNGALSRDHASLCIENTASAENTQSVHESDSESDDNNNDNDGLSDYEKLRLERIRRNQEYLSRLGLEEQKQNLRPQKRARKKKDDSAAPKETTQQRKASLRRKTEQVRYSDVSMSEILGRKPRAAEAQPRKSKPERDIQHRMERFIYREFQRIQADRNTAQKQIEQLIRRTEKEKSFWKKVIEQKEICDQISQSRRAELEAERAIFGGLTLRELLKQVEQRFPELVQAARDYDQEMKELQRNEEREAEKHRKQLQIQRLCALDIYPKVLKNAHSVLDLILYERFVDLGAPQRRSNRSNNCAAVPTQQSPKIKMEDMPERPATRFIEGCGSYNGQAAFHHVGGWISPQYASIIDRSWPDRKDIYVPQAGDLVLYYPEGHRLFLENYPDTIGENNAARTPLWKRDETEKSADLDWRNQSWLHSVDAGQAVYPLICRITETHFEFPPDDPFVPSSRADGSLCWKKKEKAALLTSRQSTSVRLAISLRPLSPILPETLPLPPCFSVVWFPSDDAKPFLVPFQQAYTAFQSLSTGSTVTAGGIQVVVQHFTALNGKSTHLGDCSSTPSDHAHNSTLSISETLDNEMATRSPEYRITSHELRYIVDLVQKFFETRSSNRSVDDDTIFSLIRFTLPLWNCVSCVPKSNKRAQMLLCPWEVDSKGFHPQIEVLERSIQELVEFVIDRSVREHSRSDLFHDVLAEDEAPSYSCAVPIPMSTSVVLRKLRYRSYRSINSILNDFDTVLGNCLLYNSPDAPVVSEARSFVSFMRNNIIDAVVQSDKVHTGLGFSGVLSALQSDDDAKCLYCKPITTSPYKGRLERRWMCNGNTWTPQTGDVIIYSEKLHMGFVEFHSRDLAEMQCHTLERSTDDVDEIEAVVLWTKPCFPHQRKKHTLGTYDEDAPLLEIGLQFQEEVATVYWRPCMLKDSGPQICGCNCAASFIRPANRATNQRLSQADVDNLVLVFASLRQRCDEQTSPSNLDPTVTKRAVKEGLVPPMYPNFPITDIMPFDLPSNSSDTNQLMLYGFAADTTAEDLAYPHPELCPDLILYRMKQNHYRSRGALQNDIIESFVNAVSSRLARLSKIERSQISMMNIALKFVQNRGVDKEDRGFADSVHKIRELHAAALASAACVNSAVTLFGSKNYNATQEIISTDSSRTAARHSLAVLLSAIARDPALNFTGLPAVPTTSVKITCAGKTVTHRKDVVFIQNRMVELFGAATTLKVLFEGRPFTYECNLDEMDENEDEEPMHAGDIQPVEVNCISFTKDELEHYSEAAQFFFGRPGKQHPCARCQVKGRSFLDCRLQRRHSNIDFDLKAAFQVYGSVDGLIASLLPNRKERLATQQSQQRETTASEESHAQSLANVRTIYQNCEELLEHVTRMGTDIQRLSDLPVRLSKEFLEQSFPVDPSDGRYVYCILCGLGGDLFCCDKCPNVFHTRCLGLADVPAGEWFCEECHFTKDDVSSRLPFGRSEYVPDQLNELVEKVNSLRSMRADQMKRQDTGSGKRKNRDQDDDKNENEIASESESKSIEKVAHAKVDPKSTGQDLPRRRGRPRKVENMKS